MGSFRIKTWVLQLRKLLLKISSPHFSGPPSRTLLLVVGYLLSCFLSFSIIFLYWGLISVLHHWGDGQLKFITPPFPFFKL